MPEENVNTMDASGINRSRPPSASAKSASNVGDTKGDEGGDNNNEDEKNMRQV
jgi:hypothetical protein